MFRALTYFPLITKATLRFSRLWSAKGSGCPVYLQSTADSHGKLPAASPCLRHVLLRERVVGRRYVTVGFHQLVSCSVRSHVIFRLPPCLSFPPFLPLAQHTHSLIFPLLAFESTFPLILRRVVLQASSTVLSFGIGLQFLPFQEVSVLFCVARTGFLINTGKGLNGWKAREAHVPYYSLKYWKYLQVQG